MSTSVRINDGLLAKLNNLGVPTGIASKGRKRGTSTKSVTATAVRNALRDYPNIRAKLTSPEGIKDYQMNESQLSKAIEKLSETDKKTINDAAALYAEVENDVRKLADKTHAIVASIPWSTKGRWSNKADWQGDVDFTPKGWLSLERGGPKTRLPRYDRYLLQVLLDHISSVILNDQMSADERISFLEGFIRDHASAEHFNTLKGASNPASGQGATSGVLMDLSSRSSGASGPKPSGGATI